MEHLYRNLGVKSQLYIATMSMQYIPPGIKGPGSEVKGLGVKDYVSSFDFCPLTMN